MYAQGYIETEEAYQAAVDQEMVFRNGTYDEEEYTCASCGFTGTRAEYTETDGEYFCPQCGEVNNAVDKNHYYSYFVDTVWRDVVDALVERYGYSELAAEQKLLTGGYKIYATIDPEVQAIVDKVYENLDNVPKTVSVQQLQSAIVVTDNKTGDIVAMAGGVGDQGRQPDAQPRHAEQAACGLVIQACGSLCARAGRRDHYARDGLRGLSAERRPQLAAKRCQNLQRPLQCAARSDAFAQHHLRQGPQ